MSTATATYLDAIVAQHRASAAHDARNHAELARAALRARNEPRPFRAALVAARQAGHHPAVIAEIKRATPSKGPLVDALDPAELAERYAQGGAAAISVLTDEANFAGSPDDLAAARAASGLAVLRKDFTVSVADVYDAAVMGADAVLLIAAVLSDHEMARFAQVAAELGLDVLFEAHEEVEIARCVAAGATIIGVNQRDLVTFDVDTDRACAVAPSIPQHVVPVAESGVRDEADAARLAAAGYAAVLVGETLVRSADPAGDIARLRGTKASPRPSTHKAPTRRKSK